MLQKAKKIFSYVHPLIIEQGKGEVLKHIEVRIDRGKYTLDGNIVNYSFGSLYTLFDNAFNYFNLRRKEINSALILGFGAGSVADIITKKYNSECRIIGVEKDGKVLEYAYKYFNLINYNNLRIVKTDAIQYVKNCEDKYDLIVIDLFIENRVPVEAKQIEFLRNIKDILKPNSIVFFNKITHSTETKQEAKKLSANMQDVFGSVIEHKQKLNGVSNTIFVIDETYNTNPSKYNRNL